MLESRHRDFQTETGSPLDVDAFPARIPSSAMDEDTVGRLEESKVGVKKYKHTRIWIDNRHTKPVSRNAAKVMPKNNDNMVYNVNSAEPIPSLKSTYSGSCAGGCGGCAFHPAPLRPRGGGWAAARSMDGVRGPMAAAGPATRHCRV